MKKLFAFILVLSLVLGLGAVASATTPEKPVDQKTVDITKDFTKEGTATKTPGETFAFTIEKVSVTDSQYTEDDMPMFNPTTFDITFDEGDINGSHTLVLPDYAKVGIFTYKITETQGNTAGVIYADPIYLKVFVTTDDGKLIRSARLYNSENEKKSDEASFENKFTAGDLKINKEVTGNMGEVDRYFDVTVILTGANVTAPIYFSGGSHGDNPKSTDSIYFEEDVTSKEISFKIKHDETITLSNIPDGVTYLVEETIDLSLGYEDPGYSENDKGTIDSELDTVTITNHKQEDVPTGINLDSLPYLIILAVAIGGLALFIVRKKRLAINE